MFVMPTFLRGGTNVLRRSLDVEGLFDLFAEVRVTSAAVVPTVIYLMLDHPRLEETDFSSLRTLIYAGSPMDPSRLREAVDFFGPIFIQTYAGTEPGFLTCLRKEEHRFDTPEWSARLASAGRPMFHVDVAIRDDDDMPLAIGEVGEICTRQIGQMIGYLEQDVDDGTLRDSWVHTGDVGYLDEEGFLFIVDRKKDMIITGGFNVFPRLIEDILNTHASVAQSCVFGVPDDKWGEAVKACVVLRPGASVEGDELIAFVKQRKGSVWAPKSVDIVEELPLNPNGKPDKKSLRRLYWSENGRQVG
jgi:acyl-CoA synthetase (AMP-forming)/AMP-acid ligase II